MAAANRSADTVKACASELLRLYGLVRHWAECVLPASDRRLDQEKNALFAACKALDIIMMAKRGVWPLPEASRMLTAALVEHGKLHRAVHGLEKIKPKHHWAFDVAEQMASDETIFDAFVVERLHLRVKKVVEHLTTLGSLERSALSGAVNDHARRAAEATHGCGLLGRTAPFPEMPTATVADSLEVGGFRCSVGDLIFRGEECAQVVACCLEAGALFAVVDVLVLQSALSAHSGVWSAAGAARAVWSIAEVAECAAWKQSAGSEFTVVRL